MRGDFYRMVALAALLCGCSCSRRLHPPAVVGGMRDDGGVDVRPLTDSGLDQPDAIGDPVAGRSSGSGGEAGSAAQAGTLDTAGAGETSGGGAGAGAAGTSADSGSGAAASGGATGGAGVGAGDPAGAGAGQAGQAVPPCPDADGDGICNAQDHCPLGADADTNANGYPDACETTLWQANSSITQQYVQPALANAGASFSIYSSCPAQFFGREVETAPTTTRTYDVATNSAAAAFLACVQATNAFSGGMELELWSGTTNSPPYSGPLGDPRAALTGKHVYYFVRELTYSAKVITDRFGDQYNDLRYAGSWRAVGY